MKRFYFFYVLLFSVINMYGQKWTLVWADEFNGTKIDSTNWTFQIGSLYNGWGNNELEYYTSRPVNATVSNGNLLIIAKKESYGGLNYTSARMNTLGKRSWTYGKIEARIKLPMGQGLWPAFWMMGTSTTSWPQCGETDIMEHINNLDSIRGTIHWYNGGDVMYTGHTACNVAQYHIYSVVWNTDSIMWYLDGSKYMGANIENDINNTGAFHLPFFIILNMAVGGTWPGNPDASTTFPDTMFVDYVRVYQISDNVNENLNENNSINIYPNPFNQSSVISYKLSEKELVSLKVYDLIGNEVATLENEIKAPGNYEVVYNASKLKAGIYFCQLQSANRSTAKKMIIIK